MFGNVINCLTVKIIHEGPIMCRQLRDCVFNIISFLVFMFVLISLLIFVLL